MHHYIDAVEQRGQAGFVTQVGVDETVLAQVKRRRDAVREGEAVAVFRGFENVLPILPQAPVSSTLSPFTVESLF